RCPGTPPPRSLARSAASARKRRRRRLRRRRGLDACRDATTESAVPASVSPPPQATRVRPSVFYRRGLQRSAAFLHVDAELHPLAPVTLDERIAVLLERMGELLEG